jgi:acyl carrier protein
MDLKQSIKQMIIEELHLDGKTPGDIVDSAPLFGEGLGLDSLDALQLAVAVEERFGVRITDEAEGRAAFRSVEALATFIGDRKTQAKSA